MKLPDRSPAGQLIFSGDGSPATISRQRAAGRAIRLSPGVYVLDGSLPPADLARRHLLDIAAHQWPDEVVCDRSALSGALPVEGWLFLAHPAPARRSALVLPGVSISCRVGPGRLPGDIALPGGRLFLAGAARGLVENLATVGRPPSGRPRRGAGAVAVGNAIDKLALAGAGRIANILGELDVIADEFDPVAVGEVRRMLAGVLGTITGASVASPSLRARLSGSPFDGHRLELFQSMSDGFLATAPSVRPAIGPNSRWEWLPFFEAYFSNYIEGTIFTVEEARDIALHGVVPVGRPADAHDVSATYRLVSDDSVMGHTPSTATEFEELLSERHRVLMAGRPEKRPGEFKDRPNFVGSYEFVTPELLRGTLRAGFDLILTHTDPFHRAALMMFVVTECHPFHDGNGRVARLMANAELVARGEVRVVVPTAFRGNYLAALTAASNGAGRGESLLAVLDFTRQWVGTVNWSSWQAALADLDVSNATLDSALAERTGRRLRLPR